VTASSPTGSIRLELIEGGVSNRCEVDLATGEAVLFHGPAETPLARKPSALRGTSTHDVFFANVITGSRSSFDGEAPFGDGRELRRRQATHPEPTVEDLAPVRIASNGAKAQGERPCREARYLLYPQPWRDRLRQCLGRPDARTPTDLFTMLSDPTQVASLGPLQWADYPIGVDRFMMLGDNSPRSKDSRAGPGRRELGSTVARKWEVPRLPC